MKFKKVTVPEKAAYRYLLSISEAGYTAQLMPEWWEGMSERWNHLFLEERFSLAEEMRLVLRSHGDGALPRRSKTGHQAARATIV